MEVRVWVWLIPRVVGGTNAGVWATIRGRDRVRH
jgi:hypothetical protein